MARPGQAEFERIRYWQGQRLRGRDFRDLAAVEAQLRWWHNRALHNTFGVRFGFEVAPVSDADSVEVSCGVAYDCFGRELILQSKRRVALPVNQEPPASKMTLVARYKENSQFQGMSETSHAGANSHEAPAFLWKRSSAVEIADGVPLARLSYESTARLESLPAGLKFPDSLATKTSYDEGKKLLVFKGVMTTDEQDELSGLSSESLFQQAVTEIFEKSQLVPVPDETFSIHRARPLARPRIGSGKTSAGHTAWELWSQKVFSLTRVITDMPLGMQVTIDTSAAGFTQMPRYFAWLQGSLWDRSNIEFFPAPLTHIDDGSATTKQFRFRIWMPNIIAILGNRARLANQDFKTEFLNFSQSKKLFVCWLGIQCAEDTLACDEIEECQCQIVNED